MIKTKFNCLSQAIIDLVYIRKNVYDSREKKSVVPGIEQFHNCLSFLHMILFNQHS